MHGYLPCSVAVGYDPMLGRFTSPDSIVPEPGSVIGYNRYAYVSNNPIIYTDPSGHSQDGGIGDPGCSPNDPICYTVWDGNGSRARANNFDLDLITGTIYDDAYKYGSDTFEIYIPDISKEQLANLDNMWEMYKVKSQTTWIIFGAGLPIVAGTMIGGLWGTVAGGITAVVVDGIFMNIEDTRYDEIKKQYYDAYNNGGLLITMHKNSDKIDIYGGGELPTTVTGWTPGARGYLTDMVNSLLNENDMMYKYK